MKLNVLYFVKLLHKVVLFDTHSYCVTAADWVVGLAVGGSGQSSCFFLFLLSFSLPFPSSLMESPSTGTVPPSLQEQQQKKLSNKEYSQGSSPEL